MWPPRDSMLLPCETRLHRHHLISLRRPACVARVVPMLFETPSWSLLRRCLDRSDHRRRSTRLLLSLVSALAAPRPLVSLVTPCPCCSQIRYVLVAPPACDLVPYPSPLTLSHSSWLRLMPSTCLRLSTVLTALYFLGLLSPIRGHFLIHALLLICSASKLLTTSDTLTRHQAHRVRLASITRAVYSTELSSRRFYTAYTY